MIRTEWNACQALLAPESERLPALFDLIRPMVLDAMRRVGLGFAYLLPEHDLPLVLAAKASAMDSLPKDQETFEIWLDSSILRWMRDAKESKLSSLRDPMAPWVEFRRRVNSLRKSFRTYFLAFLPRTMGGQATPGWAGRNPNWHWAQLWDRLTDEIPASCLPTEWQEVRNGIEQPVKVARCFEPHCPGILKPKDFWRERFATPIFGAALLIESRRPSWIRFHGDPEVMPASATQHGKTLRETLLGLGGIPKGGGALEEMVRGILEWESGVVDLSSHNPSELLLASQELGYQPFEVETYLGAIAERSSHPLEANRHFQKSLSEAKSHADISTALSNLAARALVSGDYSQAIRWSEEALQYDGSNEMARWNLKEAVRALSPQFGKFGTHD